MLSWTEKTGKESDKQANCNFIFSFVTEKLLFIYWNHNLGTIPTAELEGDNFCCAQKCYIYLEYFMKKVKLKLTNLVKEGERLYRY